MKLLAAILVFMIAAQPVQAGFCDMQPSGDTAAHSGMQHDMQENDQPDHDCCAPSDEVGSENCESMVQCGACSVAAAAVFVVPVIAPVPEMTLRSYLNDSGVPPSHASPPYRPPILIS